MAAENTAARVRLKVHSCNIRVCVAVVQKTQGMMLLRKGKARLLLHHSIADTE
jgi:hypothetical protein